MARAVFVAGAHTDIGKTHVACALLEAARRAGLSVAALKPVVSGFDLRDWGESDPGRLLAAAGEPLTDVALQAISPWRFAARLAPPMAARAEGKALSLAPIADFCRQSLADATADLMVVEGVGGVMSPIADDATGLDLMLALGLPTVLVGGSYLGSISHLLTALETLRARELETAAVVISESPPPAPDFFQTIAEVERFAALTPVLAASRGGDNVWAEALLALISA